jgi:hypothetical protein
MAVPRPVLLALLGLALCAAAFMATRGAREPGGSSVAAVPAAPVPAPAQAVKKAAPAKAAAKPKVSKAAAAVNQGTKAADTKAQAKPQPKPQPAPAPQRTAEQRTAIKVTKALAKGDAVVFFFTRAGAADDTGTRQAVRAIKDRPHVTVVRAGLKDLTAFRPVLSGAGVSQVPAVVVAHAGKPARLLEGYVDSGTLRQAIADALR